MPEILILLAPLLLGSIHRVRKRATLTVAGKKKKPKNKQRKKLFQKVGAVSLVCN
jgi:hypothetical protein